MNVRAKILSTVAIVTIALGGTFSLIGGYVLKPIVPFLAIERQNLAVTALDMKLDAEWMQGYEPSIESAACRASIDQAVRSVPHSHWHWEFGYLPAYGVTIADLRTFASKLHPANECLEAEFDKLYAQQHS